MILKFTQSGSLAPLIVMREAIVSLTPCEEGVVCLTVSDGRRFFVVGSMAQIEAQMDATFSGGVVAFGPVGG